MSLDVRIGEKLRLAREAAALSQADAASLLELPLPDLHAMEEGSLRTNPKTLCRAARAYDVEIRCFFEPSKDLRVTSEDKFLIEAASISILRSFRTNKALSKLCETVRESDYSGRSRKSVA